jgi:hypothetical protein
LVACRLGDSDGATEPKALGSIGLAVAGAAVAAGAGASAMPVLMRWVVVMVCASLVAGRGVRSDRREP